MRFSDFIQSFQCWDELISKCQGEVKFLEDVRSYLSQRKKIQEEYAEQIKKLDIHYLKLHNTSKTGFFADIWPKLLQQSTIAANVLTKGAETFNEIILAELNTVCEKKKQNIADISYTKNRLEKQISIVSKDITQLKSSIVDFAKATEFNKEKYQDSIKDARPQEYQDKYRCRFISNATKLYEYNNDYNILLNVSCMHETSYIQHILPAWLDYHQHLLASQINEVKSLLRYSFELLLNQDESNSLTMVMSTVYSIISKANFKSEYNEFLETHVECPKLIPAQEEYSTSLQKFTTLNLPIRQLTVNELTESALKAKVEAMNIDLQNIDEKLETKTQKLHKIEFKDKKDEMREIKKFCVKAQVHELHAQRCRYQMTANFVRESLNIWKDKPLEPFFKLLPIVVNPVMGGTSPLSSVECLGAVVPSIKRSPSTMNTLNKIKHGFLTFGRTLATATEPRPPLVNFDVLDGEPVNVTSQEEEDYVVMTKEEELEEVSEEHEESYKVSKVLLDTEPSISLESQPWFYADITRQETAELLQYKTQFIIRKTIDSKRRTAVLVLSVNIGDSKIKHFIMQINEEGKFRLEGDWFTSLQALINYHITTGKPITSRSNVVIRQAVLRDKWNLLHRDIRLKQFLGQGNFGEVYHAQMVSNGKEVAVKTCREEKSEEFREQFIEEANVLKKFHHKNVVRLLGICSDEVPYYIVMEYMNNGSLLSVLQEGAPLPLRQLVHYCEQAASGMAYLHSQEYIHRDLAARNCLVHNMTILKISDFGMSRQQKKNDVYISKMKQIPIRWTAPEALMFRTYTFKCDVWSYGILMWEIFNKGAYPYSDMTNRDVKDQIDAGYRLPKTRNTPDDIYQIMFDCWKYDPKARPTFEDVHLEVKTIYIEQYSEQAGQREPLSRERSIRYSSISSTSSVTSSHGPRRSSQ